MIIKQNRTVLHLAITKSTVLRVILYIANDKIDWYNDNDMHSLVLTEIQPIILNNLIKDQEQPKKQKDTDKYHTLYGNGFRLVYRFTSRNMQQTIIKTEREYEFMTNEEEKPVLNTFYKALSLYPDQLVITVDNEIINNNTLHSYFTVE